MTPKTLLFTPFMLPLRDYIYICSCLSTVQEKSFPILWWISCLIVLLYSVFHEEYFIKLLKISSYVWFLSYFSLKYTFLFLLIQKLFKVFGFLRMGKRTKPPKNLHILFIHQVLYSLLNFIANRSITITITAFYIFASQF